MSVLFIYSFIYLFQNIQRPFFIKFLKMHIRVETQLIKKYEKKRLMWILKFSFGHYYLLFF